MVSAWFPSVVGIVVAFFALRVACLGHFSGRSHGIISGTATSASGPPLPRGGGLRGEFTFTDGQHSRDGRHPEAAFGGRVRSRGYGVVKKKASLVARLMEPSVGDAGARVAGTHGTHKSTPLSKRDKTRSNSTMVVPVSLYSALFVKNRTCHLRLASMHLLNCGMDGSVFVAEMRCITPDDNNNGKEEDHTMATKNESTKEGIVVDSEQASAEKTSIQVVVGVKVHVFGRKVGPSKKTTAGWYKQDEVWDYCRKYNKCPAYAKWADLYESQYRSIYESKKNHDDPKRDDHDAISSAKGVPESTKLRRQQFSVPFGTAEFGESALRGAPLKCGARRGFFAAPGLTLNNDDDYDDHRLSSFVFPIVGGWESANVETWLRNKRPLIDDVGHHHYRHMGLGHERPRTARSVLRIFKHLRKNARLIHCDISQQHLLYLAGKPGSTMLIDFGRMLDCERENLKCEWFFALQLWQLLQLVGCVCTRQLPGRDEKSVYCRTIPNNICQGWKTAPKHVRLNASSLLQGLTPCLAGPASRNKEKILSTALAPLAEMEFPYWVYMKPARAAAQNTSAGFARIEKATETLWRGLEDIFGFT